jgi:cold shock CspA family protein
MAQGTIRSESTKGYWFVEDNESNRSFFVHHSQVADERFLHVGDIVAFDIVPNPVRPGQQYAGNVKYVGRVSDKAVSR